MREHQLAGCGKQIQHPALVTVFDETRRETLRHTKDQEQRELGTPTGQRRHRQPRQLTWDQGKESSRRDRRSGRRAASDYHDGSQSSSSSPVKLPRREREKASSTEDGKRRTAWSPALEIVQERRFKEYATGNRKYRREDVAHFGSRQDAKAAEHYNGARRRMRRELTSTEDLTSDSDDASSSRADRRGDGKLRRNDATDSRGKRQRQQGTAAAGGSGGGGGDSSNGGSEFDRRR